MIASVYRGCSGDGRGEISGFFSGPTLCSALRCQAARLLALLNRIIFTSRDSRVDQEDGPDGIPFFR